MVIRNYDAEIFAFSNRLGEKFNEATLRTALTHKSYVERETARLSAVGVDSYLQIQDNEELAVAGGEMISKFTNGYLRAVFTHVPEELIMYVSYSNLPKVVIMFNSIGIFVFRAMHDFLTSTSNLETVGKNIGLGDLILCSVSFYYSLYF